MLLEGVAIGREQRGGDLEFDGRAFLRVDQYHFLRQLWVKLGGADHLQHHYVVPEAAQYRDRLLESGRVEKVGDQHHQSARARHREVPAQRSVHARAPATRETGKKTEYTAGLVAAAACRQHFAQPVGKRGEVDAVLIEQCNIGQRTGNLSCVVEFSAAPMVHRLADIDENVG